MFKTRNTKAWLGVLPVVLIVSFSGVIPLMAVVNYSVQDILDFNTRFFVGLQWYQETLQDPRFIDAFLRQIAFSISILIVEVPLGIIIARGMPRTGWTASVILVLLAIPLLIPWNVVGTIWQLFARSDIGLLGVALNAMGFSYNYTADPLDAWLTLLAMDVWHWTSLVALLAYAGLSSVPSVYYQAAELDGANAWHVFRHIELPRLKSVLIIAILLRLIDSFMIYTEPFVLTGGGPGNTTSFLSQYLATIAVGQFDLGPAAAFSVIYFLFTLLFCWLFYSSVVTNNE